MCVCLHWQSYITNIELFKIIRMISEFYDRLNIVRLININIGALVKVGLPQCAGEWRCLDYNPAFF